MAVIPELNLNKFKEEEWAGPFYEKLNKMKQVISGRNGRGRNIKKGIEKVRRRKVTAEGQELLPFMLLTISKL